jgi:ribose-phosphate pyrophosphokinase
MHNQPLIFSLFGQSPIAQNLGHELGKLSIHSFPDGESLVQFDTPVEGRDVILLGSLDNPNSKLAELLLVAGTAKELGASKVA